MFQHTAANGAAPALGRWSPFHFALVSLGVLCALAFPSQAADPLDALCINEFLTVNQRSLTDDDGVHSGWIELYNAGKSTVSLAGCYLTDYPTNQSAWRFPKISLLPDTYLVVFASGKGRTNDLAHLHTGFKLNPRGGYLALVSPTGRVLSEFAAYPKQVRDVSCGRLRGELAETGFFSQPTPGKPNSSRGPEFAPEVSFSRASGGFTVPFALQLNCVTSRTTVIRYTLDGSLPTSASPVYAAPLLITNTALVRARAYRAGRLPGAPRGETYFLLHSNVLDFTSTLSVVVLDTLGKDTPVQSHSELAQMFFYEPVHGTTSLTNRPALTTRGGFHQRGSSTGGMAKGSYAVELLDEFNRSQAHPVLGLPADSDWVLYAVNGFEPVLIHNPFAHQLSRDMGCYSPRTRFVEMFLTTRNGPVTAHHYQGIYVLEEKIKIGKQRVAIERAGPDDLQPPGVTGGYVLKVDRLGPDEGGFYSGGVTVVYVEPKEAVLSLPQRAAQVEYLHRYFRDFDRALDGPNWKDPVIGYRAFIDVDSWIDYHVLEVLTGNVDALRYSAYFHKPRAGKIRFGPHWDFDRALGSTDRRDDDPREWNTGPFFSMAWWPRLFSDPDFWQQWVDRWQDLRQTHFSLPNLFGMIDRLADELREAQPREVQRWGVHPRGGNYQAEIDLMKSWLSNRVDFIDRQLAQPPGFSQNGGKIAHGFALTLTGPAGAKIYYTLDASDPRRSQGGIATNAVEYTGPILLKSDTWVTARANDPARRQTGGPPSSTPWSRRISAQFTISKK